MNDCERVWEAICKRAQRLGVQPLNALPGCWYQKLTGGWEFAVNGHNEPKTQKFEQHDEPVGIGPFHLYAEFNGWPAATLTPYGGEIAAGAAANVDTFIEALEAA